MTAQKSFGRRTIFPPPPLRTWPKLEPAAASAKPVIAEVPTDQALRLRKEILFSQGNDERREPEQAIKPKLKVPWRQVSLMASLCFGIASFVLPDSINDNLDWLLYGLMAMSAYVGLSKRFIKS
jgi:hypothetical protein